MTLRLHNLQRQGAFVTETFAGVNAHNATLMFRSVRIPMRKRSLFAKPDGFIPPHDKEDEMNKHTATTALAAAFALALSGAALAEDPMSTAPEAETTFEALDGNADGYIVQSEVPMENELYNEFALADQDDDARLNRLEYDQFLNPPEEEEAEE